MVEFASNIVSVLTALFTGLIECLAGLGTLIFQVGEAGAVSGLTPFGILLSVLVGVPLATWLFGKAFTFVKSIATRK